jgi:hypothetical protein
MATFNVKSLQTRAMFSISIVVAMSSALLAMNPTASVGKSLVCTEDLGQSDVILVENFDPNYLVFERAAALQSAGLASRVLVPVQHSGDPSVANAVSRGVAEVMARQARLNAWEIVLIGETEPVTLNAAFQVRTRLAQDRVRSIIVVAPGFRSRRSALVYHAVLKDLDARVYCVPVFGRIRPDRWTDTWHGIQQVTEELLKLQYYRLYVLPSFSRKDRSFALPARTTSPRQTESVAASRAGGSS